MLKLAIIVGIPSVITFLTATSAQQTGDVMYIFLLTGAVLIAIISQLNEKFQTLL